MGGKSLAFAVCGTLAIGCAGPTYDTSPPFTPDPPATYVAKVKNILVGLPPTDDEVAAVTADPAALPGLIDGWMALPQYQQKMMVFFELAFQQTQITEANFIDIVPANGLGNGKALPLMVQNARESFARTVLAMNAAGMPLNQAFKTKTLMMTPALMQLYAFLDGRTADNAGKVSDGLVKMSDPTLTLTMTAAAIPLADSVDVTNANGHYMWWGNPDLATQTYIPTSCEHLDPITITLSSFSLYQIMYGEIPGHKGALGETCAVKAATGKGIQLAPEDFTTWKMVTIRPPHPGEKPMRFYDLATLRAATELVIGTPRPGFFSTPAFFANWPTNQSNQMRVTLNQALIVATGRAVDGNDTKNTTPATTPGLDTAHAGDGACFSCHQLLDPTRSILASTYSWFYNPQTDPMWTAQPGLFAFEGMIEQMTTIDQFADILSRHPLVPEAWAQKLCYYVNSAPCAPTDAEFGRIRDDFATGFSWNTLVRELLSSPITTNTTDTTTYNTNGEVIAVARRDHLCAALNNRLGFVDICQLDAANQAVKTTTISQIVSGMPSDGYGRGATIPVLPNEPTLFYRGGLENICAEVSGMVVDAPADPMQPGAKKWSSAQPDAAIADFVSIVLGLTSLDPRAAQANAALTAHFAAAKQGGATATDSLRSTFVAACLAPSFIGIGL